MAKRVTVAVTMDDQFVRLLAANIQLSPRTAEMVRGEGGANATPADVLKVLVFMEARGALEEQVHAVIPPAWRPNIEVEHSLRRVVDVETGRVLFSAKGSAT